ncbi:MAG: hypothetical protein IJ906_11880, partial [Oscillospiraceae bacterium]|nr:hypothetical protein [Oscillospiraceae bacterium]
KNRERIKLIVFISDHSMKKHPLKRTSKNYVFRGGGVRRSPTHSSFAFRRKAKGEFRDAHNTL